VLHALPETTDRRRRMSDVRTSIAAVLVAAALVGHDAGAGVVQSKCLVGKNRCVSKRAVALLVCEERAQKPGKPVDPNDGGCLDKAKRDFDGSGLPGKGCFNKLEGRRRSDCVTFDDDAGAAQLVDACVARVATAINPPGTPQTKCGAAKVRCASKKLKGLLACYAKTEGPGKPVDPAACIAKVKDKFDGGIVTPEKGCFEKLEGKAKTDCVKPFDNTTEVENLLDDCVDDLIVFLEDLGVVTTSTATSSSSTTSESSTTTTSEAETTSTTLADAS
jgi:hypothetical protein